MDLSTKFRKQRLQVADWDVNNMDVAQCLNHSNVSATVGKIVVFQLDLFCERIELALQTSYQWCVKLRSTFDNDSGTVSVVSNVVTVVSSLHVLRGGLTLQNSVFFMIAVRTRSSNNDRVL